MARQPTKTGKKQSSKLSVETIIHDDAKRTNIPTAELQPVVRPEDQQPVAVTLPRRPLEDERTVRNRDLDPQLVWKGKDEQDWSDLVVQAPPIYIQEKIHPKHLIDDLVRQTEAANADDDFRLKGKQLDIFSDFNGLPSSDAKTEFYQHEGHWQNRMILGDSLQVMASLAEREGLRGKVQCIYFDPPYGIKFNSNFQWSTTSRDVKDGNAGHITREPEQVKAFRDTWRDGIHSYLTYLRDRLTAVRDLLSESGSIFVQISDENMHRVRGVMDEVFGEDNFSSVITFQSTTSLGTLGLSSAGDYVVWYYKNKKHAKYRPLLRIKSEKGGFDYYSYVRAHDGRMWRGTKEELENTEYQVFFPDNITSQRPLGDGDLKEFEWKGKAFRPGKGTFKTDKAGLDRLAKADRLYETSGNVLRYVRLIEDYPVVAANNLWTDTGTGSFTESKVYVVQTNTKVIERCMLMVTDPGDLVLDPTCGSGTTATMAEQWGRRWITIDTSRVALALARTRIMGARYPFYLLSDSVEGLAKEAQISRREPSSQPVYGKVRHGFVYERVPHIMLSSITNNAEIDVIWDQWRTKLDSLCDKLNATIKQSWKEWEIPREADPKWPEIAKKLHADWWQARIARQQEIDKSIAAKAEFEHLYDRPYEDKRKVRVAGPFTVESLSPHRMLGVDENGGLIDPHRVAEGGKDYGAAQTFAQMILDNLKLAGVQQAHKEDRITFTALTGWPGQYCCAEGRFMEGENERRVGIFIGPEFGTVSRQDLVEAAREAADAGFDVLVACAFNFDAHAGEFNKLGKIPVLKARMNADLHMAADLKNTGKGNLFVIFGEPDITVTTERDQRLVVKVNGVDVFDPSTGDVRSDNADGIACWFLDTDYNGESFFVRHAYFLGQSDPYKSLRTTLKAEIDPDVWASLNSDTSRPFPKPVSGRIAVKVINHLGDEVMKVFKV